MRRTGPNFFFRVIAYIIVFSGLWMLYSQIGDEKLEKFKSSLRSDKCGRFPQDSDIVLIDDFYQSVDIPKGTYKLQGAYIEGKNLKVTLTGLELSNNQDMMFCQIWFGDDPLAVPKIVQATNFAKFFDGETGFQNAIHLYSISCPLGYDTRQPLYVSITAAACNDAHNKLKIK